MIHQGKILFYVFKLIITKGLLSVMRSYQAQIPSGAALQFSEICDFSHLGTFINQLRQRYDRFTMRLNSHNIKNDQGDFAFIYLLFTKLTLSQIQLFFKKVNKIKQFPLVILCKKCVRISVPSSNRSLSLGSGDKCSKLTLRLWGFKSVLLLLLNTAGKEPILDVCINITKRTYNIIVILCVLLSQIQKVKPYFSEFIFLLVLLNGNVAFRKAVNSLGL